VQDAYAGGVTTVTILILHTKPFLHRIASLKQGGEEGRVLREMQERKWKRVMEWAESTEGIGKAARCEGLGLGGLKHSSTVILSAKRRIDEMDLWELTAMQSLTVEGKSFLLGLAAVEGVVTPQEICDAGRVEEVRGGESIKSLLMLVLAMN